MQLFILEPPFIYFLMFGLVVGVVFALFKRFYKPSEKIERFEGQSLNEMIVGENLLPYLKAFGRKTKKGKLIYDMNVIPISRVVKANFKFVETVKGSRNNFYVKNADFFIFQSKTSIFSRIPFLNKISGKSEFFIINAENDYINKDKTNDIWVLNKNTFLYQLGGIWICSIEGKDFVTEMVYKKIYENLKEEDMNYPKRIVWYNDQYAYTMTGRVQEYDLERRKWLDRLQNETGVNLGAS